MPKPVRSTRCPLCKGQGFIVISRPQPKTIGTYNKDNYDVRKHTKECPRCGGSGEVSNG